MRFKRHRYNLSSESKKISYLNQAKQTKLRSWLGKTLVLTVISLMLLTGIYVNSHLAEIHLEISQLAHGQLRVLGASYAAPVDVQIKPEPIEYSSHFHSMDKRAFVLNEYFRRNNSPLQGTGEIFVDFCVNFGAPADCTAVAAIARAETNLCKYYNSAQYFNCWGFGGAGPNRIYFQNWEESIERVSRSLAYSYGYEYMIDPRKMERTFCGWEPGCTGWGKRVLFFMDQIENLSKELGMGSLYALRK